MTIILKPSPNFDQRAGLKHPSYIIMHYTGMKNGKDALARLCDPSSKVSAHFTIDEDGTIYEHVHPDLRAWHAGQSYWRGERDMNAVSIGIEIVNLSHELGYRPFRTEQIQSLIPLCRDLMKAYPILPQNVLGHSDVAPARKEDPGELFPWAELARHGIGIWPEPLPEDHERVKHWGIDEYVHAARKYGYDPDCGYEFVLRAFERHFAPELILGTSLDEKIARARLAALLRLKVI